MILSTFWMELLKSDLYFTSLRKTQICHGFIYSHLPMCLFIIKWFLEALTKALLDEAIRSKEKRQQLQERRKFGCSSPRTPSHAFIRSFVLLSFTYIKKIKWGHFIKGKWKLVDSFNKEEEVKTSEYMMEAIRPSWAWGRAVGSSWVFWRRCPRRENFSGVKIFGCREGNQPFVWERYTSLFIDLTFECLF